MNKLENPIRLLELNPKETLSKAGFKSGMTLCDIGAGTGIFTFAAAKISSSTIYATEISDIMIETIRGKIAEQNVSNIDIIKVDSLNISLVDNTTDMAIMVTVLHEIDDKEFMIKEVYRILKENGKLMIIEFQKRKTPIGPPIEHRLSEEYVESICISNGFKTINKFILGDNFYCLIFERKF